MLVRHSLIEIRSRNRKCSEEGPSATLFTILVVYISKDTVITPTKIRELRNKKDISKDLEDLSRLGFITIENNNITPTSKIFYYIDINELIEKVKGLKEN